VTSSTSISGVYTLGVGNSGYATFFATGSFTCGTNYGANGVRISTAHPRYQDMVSNVRSVMLSGGWASIKWELISGQCWLKEISIFMPGT
jgi:hypothetical protein